MGATRSRKSSSTWPADAPRRARQPNERGGHARILTASGRRDGAALLVSLALLLAAYDRADLLAGRADADLGLLAALRGAKRRLFCTRGRHFHRRGAAMGHPLP